MRVVVIGAGMVGNRFADELNRLDPDIEIDVLGDESYEPYNRVLLTELLAGRVDLAGLALPRADGTRVRIWQDEAALGIDRERRIVHTAEHDFTYDHLVLATGARACIIPIPGLREGMPGGAHVLRNLNDARDIAAATLNAKHAVVIGGGPLGLEASCGLRHRGVDVMVMSVMNTLLDHDLDAAVADVLEHAAAELGITCVGAPEIGAHLSTQFDRPGILPADPLHLPMGTAAGQATESASPTTMPSTTTVCRCNGVTKGGLVHAWEGGATTAGALAEKTLATTGCGGCKALVCGIVDWLEASDPDPKNGQSRKTSQQPEPACEPTVPVR